MRIFVVFFGVCVSVSFFRFLVYCFASFSLSGFHVSMLMGQWEILWGVLWDLKMVKERKSVQCGDM